MILYYISFLVVICFVPVQKGLLTASIWYVAKTLKE